MFLKMHTFLARGKQLGRVIMCNLFNIDLNDGLKNVTFEDAKLRALESFKESVVDKLHPIIRMLVYYPRQPESRIMPLIRFAFGRISCNDFGEAHQMDKRDFYDQFLQRRELFEQEWNEVCMKYPGVDDVEERVLKFLNRHRSVDKHYKIGDLSIVGTTNTSIAPLVASFSNPGKYCY